jgi:predicted amidohydrolase
LIFIREEMVNIKTRGLNISVVICIKIKGPELSSCCSKENYDLHMV